MTIELVKALLMIAKVCASATNCTAKFHLNGNGAGRLNRESVEFSRVQPVCSFCFVCPGD